MKNVFFATAVCLSLLAGCAEKRPAVIERPVFDTWNSTTIEVDRVEMNDSSTVLHLQAFFPPNQWIRIAGDSYIRESGTGEKLVLTKADGIPLNEDYYMPESGEHAFKLYFPPLPPHVTKIDFIESDCDDCFKIFGISLLLNAAIEDEPVPAELNTGAASQQLPEPVFSAQKAVLSGRLAGWHKALGYDRIEFHKPGFVTGNAPLIEIPINDDGSFTGEVAVGFPTVLQVAKIGAVLMVPGRETKVFVDLRKQSRFQSKLRTDKQLGDSIYGYMTNYGLTFAELNAVHNRVRSAFNFAEIMREVAGMTPDQFKSHLLNRIDVQQMEMERAGMSDNAQIYAVAVLQNQTAALLLQYKDFLKTAHLEVNNIPYEERDREYINCDVAKPGTDYYSFMKDVTADRLTIDPSFANTVTRLLHGRNFSLPESGGGVSPAMMYDRLASPADMMAYLKKITAFYAGDDREALLNLACTQMFGEQLRVGKFFSESDHETYKAIFANQAYADALLAENDMLEALLAATKTASGDKFTINETPDVAQDEVFDAIVAKYKGRAVVVDFWATWCGPCIRSFREMKPVKESLEGKEVVFVYLTGETSPLLDWNRMIPDIHGEHYRVSDAQWEQWYRQLEIEGVPTFMIFDRDSKPVSRYTGFPGVETVRGSIAKALGE